MYRRAGLSVVHERQSAERRETVFLFVAIKVTLFELLSPMPISVLSLVLLARTAAGSTSPALIPLLRHEHAILVRVGPYRDGKRNPTWPHCVEAITLLMQLGGGMRAVDKSPVDSSGSSLEPAFQTTGSREFFLLVRSLASRFKGRAQRKVPAACREGSGSTGCASARRGFSGATRRSATCVTQSDRLAASVLGGPST